ncbi:MAG: inositol monophosphatase family protein [Candidatus Omnitrophota bacterium]
MVDNLGFIKKFFLAKIVGLRSLGRAVLDLVYVARGRAAGFWKFKLNPWDFAAGKLIVEEAGGVVSGRYGERTALAESFIVASNGKIHQMILAVFK